MRQLTGVGTPKEAAARGKCLLLVLLSESAAIFILASDGGRLGILVVIVAAEPA